MNIIDFIFGKNLKKKCKVTRLELLEVYTNTLTHMRKQVNVLEEEDRKTGMNNQELINFKDTYYRIQEPAIALLEEYDEHRN